MLSNTKIIKLEEIHSTNELCKSFLKENTETLPFLIQAEYQTKGKGQMGKHWISNKSENLLCSLAFNPDKITIENQFFISQSVALSIHKTLANFQISAQIKWPNDIYIGRLKIAGILIENTITNKHIDNCVIGLGFNINQNSFPPDLKATSIKKCINKEVSVNDIREMYLKNLDYFLKKTSTQIKENYEALLYQRNITSIYKDERGSFKARILGVDQYGRLIIKKEDGSIQSYINNSIIYL